MEADSCYDEIDCRSGNFGSLKESLKESFKDSFKEGIEGNFKT